MLGRVAGRLAFKINVMRLSEMPVSIFDFSGNIEGGHKERQQFAIDMLYRCWKSSLVEVFHDAIAEGFDIRGVDEFVGRLAGVRLFEDSLSDEGVIWHAPQFETTVEGAALLDRNFPRGVDVENSVEVLNFNK